MDKAYVIVECVGPSIYEEHTIPYVYLRREWAEYQLSILEQDSDFGITLKIREVTIVTKGPNHV